MFYKIMSISHDIVMDLNKVMDLYDAFIKGKKFHVDYDKGNMSCKHHEETYYGLHVVLLIINCMFHILR